VNFELPALPYEKNALEPHISARTLDFHYDKHHRGYMTKLKNAIEGKPEADKSLEQLVQTAEGGVFNNAAQVWNHTFYWNSMAPDGGGKPEGKLLERIEKDFHSHEDFAQQFAEVAKGEFGSGWAWLVEDGDRLRVLSTHDADNPLRHGMKPLLTIDVWEHAYYLDFQNDRASYVQGVIDHLLDWRFAQALEAGLPDGLESGG